MTSELSNADLWNRAFTETAIFHWHEPDPLVRDFLDRAEHEAGQRVLDIGTGYGRHAIAFARRGYEVTAMDVATVCLERLQAIASQGGLTIVMLEHDMNSHPYPLDGGSFDVVVAIQSIHHTNALGLRMTIAEIRRLLRPGGVLLTDLKGASESNRTACETTLEPNTFVPLDGPERGIPHHYVDEAELRDLLAEFDPVDIGLDERSHWTVVARLKRGAAEMNATILPME